MKRTPIVLSAAACAALLVAGCGSDKKNESTQAATPTQTQTQQGTVKNEPTGGASAEGGQTLQLSADPSGQLKFDKDTLTAKAGKVTLDMANPATVPHAIGVRGNGVDKDGPVAQTKGESSTITVTLKPGKYTFYCPVDQHEQSGMKGTLTVK